MESNNKNDILDSLFFAAASSAGKEDINEYNSDVNAPELSPNVYGRIMELSGSKKAVLNKKSKGLSLRRKLLIIAAAALLVCSFAVATIAGKNKGSAPVTVSVESGMCILTYDTRGFKVQTGESAVPKILSDSYSFDGTTNDGASVYKKDGEEITYAVKSLDSNYSLTLGKSSDIQYFEVLISGKHSGCVYTTEKDGVKMSAVAWNDGKYAYELCGNVGTDRVLEIAQGTE